MNPLKIVCRGSKLSLVQVEIFRKKLLNAFPNTSVEIIIKETEGDLNQNQPLSEMEGRDFFTKDIQEYLIAGKADFAVHSMKDVSGENFFKDNSYAIIDRDDFRDAVIFSEDIVSKIELGEKIRLGTSSPRRIEMAIHFLSQAMPRVGDTRVKLEAVSIRGNVDTRLRKLDAKEYDGIVLACAGLNRLLQTNAKAEIGSLLRNKKMMILPIMDCPPAPGQGAIVVETSKENKRAKEILAVLNDSKLADAVSRERNLAHQYGSGCHQKFGVVHVRTKDVSFTYAAGKDRNETQFQKLVYASESKLVPASELEDSFVYTEYADTDASRHLPVAYIATTNLPQIKLLANRRVWVGHTTAWFTLASHGVWVEGSSENLGMEFISPTLESPLVNVEASEISIFSDEMSAAHWKQSGFTVVTFSKSPTKGKHA